jgi:uncharacterized protein YutE (UPF0331/DUF86 family)
MTRSGIRKAVVTAKMDTVHEMLAGIASLPLVSEEAFAADRRMVAAGESFLRRGLEALFDLARHLLAKGFARAFAEYKEIPRALAKEGVLSADLAARMEKMAGYRNRLVHFYDEVTPAELFATFTVDRQDLALIVDTLADWAEAHLEDEPAL